MGPLPKDKLMRALLDTPGIEIRVGPGAEAPAETLMSLLRPWLETSLRATIESREGHLWPAQQLVGGFLAVLWLELANAALSRVMPRRCAFEDCPGPPTRPGVFLWQWGGGIGSKHRDARYCHQKCMDHARTRRNREKGRRNP